MLFLNEALVGLNETTKNDDPEIVIKSCRKRHYLAPRIINRTTLLMYNTVDLSYSFKSCVFTGDALITGLVSVY